MNCPFERVAKVVMERVTELLPAQVTVVNHRGQAIASSQPGLTGQWLDFSELPPGAVRVPVTIEGQRGEAIVAASSEERISPRLAQVLVELIINQSTLFTALPNPHELKNKFIHDLLRRPGGEEADIVREGQILGMDFSRPRAVILIDAADYILSPMEGKQGSLGNAQVWRRAQLIISSIVNFFHLPNDTICAYIGDGEVAVLKASSTQDLVAWAEKSDQSRPFNPSWANLTALKRAAQGLLLRLQQDTAAPISIGVGRYHPELQGLARSYQDARAALSLGQRFHGQNQVHCLDSLGISAFVGIADETTKIDLARHLLSPLDQEAELLETLNLFFQENCCPSSTASLLCIHRNTLSYRLDKITSLTGLDPRQFDHAMQIRLALLLRSLQTEEFQLGKRTIPVPSQKRHLRQMSDVLSG